MRRLKLLSYHLALEKSTILAIFCNPQNSGIRMPPIPRFGIGDNGRDPGTASTKISMRINRPRHAMHFTMSRQQCR